MTDNKKLESLRERVLDTFPKNDPLPCIYLTGHRCEECDGLRDDFCEKNWWAIEDEIVNKNYDKLPLFTSSAYHYYLPAFLLQSLKYFFDDNLLIDFVVYSLGPLQQEPTDRRFRERRAFFSQDQRSVIRDFLELVLNDIEMGDVHKKAERALNEFWEEV